MQFSCKDWMAVAINLESFHCTPNKQVLRCLFRDVHGILFIDTSFYWKIEGRFEMFRKCFVRKVEDAGFADTVTDGVGDAMRRIIGQMDDDGCFGIASVLTELINKAFGGGFRQFEAGLRNLLCRSGKSLPEEHGGIHGYNNSRYDFQAFGDDCQHGFIEGLKGD